MMQSVNTDKVKEIRTIEIEQSCDSSTGGTLAAVKPTSVLESSNFGPDIMSGSEEDEALEVDSFILDEGDMEDNEHEESKFLLAAETSEAEGHGIQNVDPQTQARLEALLEAAGISKLSSKDGKALSDPEVLRTLTSSVSSALDEAAQSLHRMRETQGQPVSGERVPLETSGESESFGPRSCSGTADSPEEGESLLSLACSAGYYELAQVLLAMKANVEDRGLKGDCTPLMEAASGGHVDIVRLLLLHKADINAHSSAGNTPLHYGACGGFKEVVEELMKNGANVEVHNENGHTPLMEAASAGHVDVAKILLEHGAGINTHSNEFKESALTLACYKGHLDMVKFLLEAGADQEHKTDEMHTALMEASMDGHVEVARLLLDSGAQVNMPADSFESPLTLAACGGHIELANLLIERGANIEEVNDEGYTPLMEAAREGHEEMVALLLSQDADINAQTEETQETALTLACCGGFLEVAEYLLSQGANIELGCSTPLMEAAQEGHLELVSFLLQKGAKVEATTGTGDTALTYACENGHTDVAEALLENGANLEHESEGGRTPLMKAARAGHLCTVQFLISKGADVNRATTSNDHTVLSLACAGGHLAVVELLLTQHADVNHKLKDGSTMVIEAAKGGHTQVVKLLLEWPNRFLVTAEQLAQIDAADVPMVEPRVPVQGLANIVPPSEPDSQIPMANVCLPSNIQVNYSKSLIKRPAATQPDPRTANKFYSPVITENFQLCNEEELLDDKSSEKDDKTCLNQATKEEQIMHGKSQAQMLISAQHENEQQQSHRILDDKSSEKDDKTCLNQATKEEQNLRKEQILEELVDKKFQEKQSQMLLSAQQEAEQQQSQAKLKQASPSTPISSTSSSVFSASISTSTVLATARAGSAAISKSDQLSKQSEELAKILDTPSQKMWMPNALCYDQITDIAKMLASGDLGQPSTEAYLQQVAQFQHHSQLYLLQQQQEQMQISATPPPPPLTSASSTISSGLMTDSRGATKNQGNKRTASNKQIRSAKSSSQAPPPPPPPQPVANSMKSGSLLPLIGTNQQQNLLNSVQPIVFQSEHNGVSQSSEAPQTVVSTPQGTIDSVLCQHVHALQQQQQQAQPFNYLQQPDQFLQPGTAAQQMFNHQHSYQLQTLLPQQVQQGQHVQQIAQGVTNTQVTTAQAQLSQQQQHVFQQQQQQAQQLLQQQPLKLPNTAGNHTIAITKPQVVVRKQRVTQSPTQAHNHQNTASSVDGNVSAANLQNMGAPNAAVNSLYSSVDVDSQTESNHDTALTLACAGGYAELVSLLLAKGADIEHRDKKGFTPLILSATAGHVDVVEILLDHEADIEAQSERTKDTPLSLACSGGRYEVVELLLGRGANKEHRNVSDYTPLSLAASGGYVNIIKLLLTHNAEINSRTGSKLGISPLMLAAMNGHTAAVKLLLDMGSDINAQIETNRNTALTLACFQGRHEVVSLLVDRKANIEHRAKTGLTPLMEAASGGYVEVGRVLLDKGADVNAPPVPSSRDTALTIAADKGHYRFVELLLHRGASVDVKNKKGNSPLWLACNGGHSDVVSLLVQAEADIDSQDNRKVSCLMAAFRRGHIKVVKWMVKKVTQFPSENEIKRYICTVTDKDLQKKCNQCADVIVTAKDRQAAEANKNADSLLEEIKQEKEKAALRAEMASKRRERRRERKRKGKQKDEKEEKEDSGKNSSPEPEGSSHNKDEEEDEEEEDSNSESNGSANSNTKNGNIKNLNSSGQNKNIASNKTTTNVSETIARCPEITPAPVTPVPISDNTPPTKSSSAISSARASRDSRKRQQKNIRESKREVAELHGRGLTDDKQTKSPLQVTVAKVTTLIESIVTATTLAVQVSSNAITHVSSSSVQGAISSSVFNLPGNKVPPTNSGNNRDHTNGASIGGSNNKTRGKKSTELFKPTSSTGIGDLDDFGVALKNQEKVSNKPGSKKNVDKKEQLMDDYRYIEKALSSRLNVSAPSPRKGQKKEEGWKEVVRKNMTKKLMVPANVTARLIGKGGCHINAIREISGAHVEVEKAKGMADRSVTIKGSQESIRQANSLINAMIEEPDKDISDILNKANKSHTKAEKPQAQQKVPVSLTDFPIGTFSVPASSSNSSSQVTSSPSNTKSPGPTKSSRQASNQVSGLSRSASNTMGSTIGAWQNPVPGQITPSSPRRSPQKQITPSAAPSVSRPVAVGAEKTSSRQLLFSGEKNNKAVVCGAPSTGMASLSFTATTTTAFRGLISSSTVPTCSSISRSSERLQSPAKPSVVGASPSGAIMRAQRPSNVAVSRAEPMPLPIVTSNSSHGERPSSTQPAVGEYTPFNSLFSSFLAKKDEPDKMDFASVAAAGVVSTGPSTQANANPASVMSNPPANTIDPALKAKAPGYKIPQRGNSPPFRPELENNIGAYRFTSTGTAVGSGPRPTSMPSHPPIDDYHMKMIRYSQQQYNQMRENSGYIMHPPMMGAPGGLMYPQAMGRMHLPHGQVPMAKEDFGKPEYSKPHRPMTLPEIKGALNPNAPEFQLPTGPPMMNGYDRNGGPALASLMGVMTPEQAMTANMVLNSGIPEGMQNINATPGMGPLNQAPLPHMMQSGEMLGQANIQFLMHQVRPPAGAMASPNMGGGSPPQLATNRLSSSLNAGVGTAPPSQESPPQGMMGPPGLSPAPGNGAGFIGPPQRNHSPMPTLQGARPNSAPSIQPESSHIGAPPRGGSPMTSCSPPLESGKRIQPIGGERKRVSARSGSTGNANSFGNVWSYNGTSEYSNPEWSNGGSPVMTAAVLPSSVITSSVVSGSHMVYSRVPEADERLDYNIHSTPHFKEGGVMPGSDGDHNINNVPNMMSSDMYANGPYPIGSMFPPKGGAGDSQGSVIWNASMAAAPNDQPESERWQTWSQQAEI